ncbi:hypothetical protein I6A84_02495 [Frankia sp. CNm7]|uniref:Uncharacterized protein n=1 Tax=Frankia nepalensis TaxID=1836974 RepID=A0A937UQP0_9ACTN|nr:hypothetical protein [Frankia nepalensis]MBL7502018.1 hypothetical protein [Frankia nepalensis]MBL7510306.1 hypothetical protein [Frankia nepalensis]MBL7517024.1 hypothetical protein [Frankia nepalensis]MBL7630437.1 hypothetical protein [Frankia nepalensis]
MPSVTVPRTLLAHLLAERHWTVDEFVRQFNRAGRRSGPDRRDHAISRRQATRWVAGRLPSLPHPASCRVLETMFDTTATALLAPPGGHTPNPAGRPDGQTTTRSGSDDGNLPAAEEVSPTDRRTLLATGLLFTTSATTLGPVDQAARISRVIAASTPDPLTLAQLQHGIHRLTTRYAITPHAELVAPIEQAWTTAEALLDSRVTGPTRTDLELVAGQYALYRGLLAFGMGDDHAALTFLVLAGQHAEAARDSLLAGSVAVLRSMVAFFAGEFATAADIARRAQPGAHPYVVPTLASSLARALAQTGDADGALAALRTMRDNIWTGPPLPGPEPGDEETYEAFSAVTLGYLNRGDQAEPHARNSLTLLGQTGRYAQLAGTHLALARAFIRRQTPDPEQAASAVNDALRAAAGKDHIRTTTRAHAIYHHLNANPNWARLPAVQDLGDRLPTLALPAGQEVAI